MQAGKESEGAAGARGRGRGEQASTNRGRGGHRTRGRGRGQANSDGSFAMAEVAAALPTTDPAPAAGGRGRGRGRGRGQPPAQAPPPAAQAPVARGGGSQQRPASAKTGRGRPRSAQAERQHSGEGKPRSGDKAEQAKPKAERSSSDPKQATGGRRDKKPAFTPHLEQEDLQRGIKGTLRINPKRPNEAYGVIPGFHHDVLIDGLKDRNRALEGDVIAIQLRPRSTWKTAEAPTAEEGSCWVRARNLPYGEERNTGKTLEALGAPPTKNVRWLRGEAYLEYETAEAAAKVVAGFGDAKFGERDVKLSFGSAREVTVRTRRAAATEERAPTQDENWLHPVGKVVAILERNTFALRVVGAISPAKGKDCRPGDVHFWFTPLDKRVPKLRVPIELAPEGFRTAGGAAAMERTLFTGQVVADGWTHEWEFPPGRLDGTCGTAGEIGAETQALLSEHSVDSRPFSEAVIAALPDVPWRIPDEERKLRRDLTSVRVFTIDPATAKDLDDALHITELADGNFEVGVHIADVSYFVRPGSAIDVEAKARSTTVYLTQFAIPMLPSTL